MDVRFFNRHIKFFLLIIVVFLFGCGGSDDGGGNNGGGTKPIVDALLTNLNHDRTSNILPGSMIKLSSVKFTAEGEDKNGSFIDLTNVVTWTTSDPNIVTVDANGLATAKEIGTAKITANLQGTNIKQDFSQEITVKAAEMNITVNKNIVFENDIMKLFVSANFSDGSFLSTANKEVWSISDSSVVSIDNSNNLTALTPGTVTITATYLSLVAEYILTVSDNFVLTASEAGLNQIVLDWTPVDGAVNYVLERKTPGSLGGFINLGNVTLTDTHYVHSGLKSDTRYVYKVTAVASTAGQNNTISNELNANTLSNNSAILTGDFIGTATTPMLSDLRRPIQVTLGQSGSALKIGPAHIARNSTSSIYSEVIIPVTNISAFGNFCGIGMRGIKFLDENGLEALTPLLSNPFLIGGIKTYGSSIYGWRCLSPGGSGYISSYAFVDTATALTDFYGVSEIVADGFDILYTVGNTPVEAAVIPQSYTATAIVGQQKQHVEVIVKNVGSASAVVKGISHYFLLDANNQALSSGGLALAANWDGTLAPGQSNSLVSDILYEGDTMQKLQVFTVFDQL